MAKMSSCSFKCNLKSVCCYISLLLKVLYDFMYVSVIANWISLHYFQNVSLANMYSYSLSILPSSTISTYQVIFFFHLDSKIFAPLVDSYWKPKFFRFIQVNNVALLIEIMSVYSDRFGWAKSNDNWYRSYIKSAPFFNWNINKE